MSVATHRPQARPENRRVGRENCAATAARHDASAWSNAPSAEFGLPPAQLVERLRTDLARTALVETDASVSQVAHLSGFGSLQRLERSFQRHMNTSPREFRARFRSPFQPEPSS